MEVLGRSGPDAREQAPDPLALAENAWETFAQALWSAGRERPPRAHRHRARRRRPPADVHDEVIEPALRRVIALREQGEIDAGG